jgi:hypothetical protein
VDAMFNLCVAVSFIFVLSLKRDVGHDVPMHMEFEPWHVCPVQHAMSRSMFSSVEMKVKLVTSHV